MTSKGNETMSKMKHPSDMPTPRFELRWYVLPVTPRRLYLLLPITWSIEILSVLVTSAEFPISVSLTIEEIHSYGTRSSKKGNFNVKACKKKRTLISISIKGVKLWNQLDANVCNVKTFNMRF